MRFIWSIVGAAAVLLGFYDIIRSARMLGEFRRDALYPDLIESPSKSDPKKMINCRAPLLYGTIGAVLIVIGGFLAYSYIFR